MGKEKIKRSKFDAAEEFTEGVKCAMFPYTTNKWGWSDSLFLAGYEYGRTLKEDYYIALNAALQQNGIDPIGTVRLADGETNEK